MSITAQIAKYDPGYIEAELKNLSLELKDEEDISGSLIENDSAKKIEVVTEFLSANEAKIAEYHKELRENTTALRKNIEANMALEKADEDYLALINSEKAKNVSVMLAEIRAMIADYREYLLQTGRAGRPPVFE